MRDKTGFLTGTGNGIKNTSDFIGSDTKGG
jgi:hypothetical protein